MATSFTLSINQAAADRVAATHAFKVVTNTTRRVLNRAIVLTPVDTGRLRAGNQSRVSRRGSQALGEVWNDVAYAGPVHDGVKAHVIRPKPKQITIRPTNAKALRFVIGGKTVFAKSVKAQKPLRFVIGGRTVYAMSVRMPARRGRPWLLRAMREVCGPEGYDLSGV